MRAARLAAVGLALALLAWGPRAAHAQDPAPAEDAPVVASPQPDEPPDAQAEGEDRGAARQQPRRRGPAVTARVAGLAGFQTFTASESFDAVLGTSSGPVFGGGGGLLLGRNLFVDVMISRFSASGSRVFVTDGGERFDLGIDTQVTVMPVDVSIGWRFAGRPRLGPTGRPVFRAVPFAGGGFGFQRYEETSEFAEGDEDVNESHGSYHVLGGIELPFSRHLGVSADVLYRWVPDAIGTTGVSAVFDETDLGGAQVRVRVTYTF